MARQGAVAHALWLIGLLCTSCLSCCVSSRQLPPAAASAAAGGGGGSTVVAAEQPPPPQAPAQATAEPSSSDGGRAAAEVAAATAATATATAAGGQQRRQLQQANSCGITGCSQCALGTRCTTCYATFTLTASRRQCYCSPGTFGTVRAGVPACVRAGSGFYAPGGLSNATTNAQAGGERIACGPNTTTNTSATVANTSARAFSDCRALPGFVIIGQNPTTRGARTRPCALGSYNPGYNTASCTLCTEGATTAAAGAASVAACTQLVPGFFAASTANATAAGGATVEYVTRAAQCRLNTYSTGGALTRSCSRCGSGVATYRVGAESPDECYVKEGSGARFDAATGILVAFVCPANTYRSGVALGLRAIDCDPCPTNTNTRGRTGAADRFACNGHPAGYGVNDQAAVVRCDVGTYNRADSDFAPCQFCGAFRTTADDPARQAAAADCFPEPGYGVYVAPAGLSPDGSDGDLDDAGFAWDLAALRAQAAASNGSVVAALASLPVVACPSGFYSAKAPFVASLVAGQTPTSGRRVIALAQQCLPCPAGSTTEDSASSGIESCAVCAPGYERRDGACKPCARGSFNSYSDSTCEQCEDQYFFLGTDALIFVPGVTPNEGATAPGDCVPKIFSPDPALPDSVLFSGLDADLRNVGAVADFLECAAACSNGTLCVALLQKDELNCTVAEYGRVPATTGSAVAAATLAATPPTPFSVNVKLPGSDTQGLGFFTSGSTTHSWHAAPTAAGAQPVVAAAGAGPDATFDSCREACAALTSCVAFVFDAGSGGCTLKGVTLEERFVGYYAGVVLP